MENPSTQSLSWGLIVATYNREKILPQCLKLATEQTLKPTEIIVIDASEHWQRTRDHVMADIAAAHLDIRWVYQGALQKGLTLQRNQGLALATADIAFLLDDDSLMYPDCAAEVMRIYEADLVGEIKGVQATLADQPPFAMDIEDQQKIAGTFEENAAHHGAIYRVQKFLRKQIFLMDAEILFIPYDGAYPAHSVPSFLKRMDVESAQVFHGCRMTFRRDLIQREGFESALRRYAVGEDLDASYRISRHGPLATALRARLHHFSSASGRLARYQVSVISVMNQAFCLRKYAKDLKRCRRLFYKLTARRILAEILKDILTRRWSLPQARGIFTGLKNASQLFTLPQQEFEPWYVNFQDEFLALE